MTTKLFLLLLFAATTLTSFTYYIQQGKANKHKKSSKVGPDYFKNIDWKAYETASSIPLDKISETNFQGLWKAYQGAFYFGGNVNTMNLTKPFIIEFKSNSFRRNESDTFRNFIVKSNMIVSLDEIKRDTGFINQLTSSDLTISWKSGNNFTRYYYKK